MEKEQKKAAKEESKRMDRALQEQAKRDRKVWLDANRGMRERCRRFPVVLFSLGRHGGEKKEKEEGETDEAEFMFHSLIFFLVFLFAFIPFVQEPNVLQRQDSMFFVLKTVEVPQCSFQSWRCSGAIISSMCARLCLTFILVCSR